MESTVLQLRSGVYEVVTGRMLSQNLHKLQSFVKLSKVHNIISVIRAADNLHWIYCICSGNGEGQLLLLQINVKHVYIKVLVVIGV